MVHVINPKPQLIMACNKLSFHVIYKVCKASVASQNEKEENTAALPVI